MHTMPAQPRSGATPSRMFHPRRLAGLLLLAPALVTAAQDRATDKALPPSDTLRDRAIASANTARDQREKYDCRLRAQSTETDSKGREKKTSIEEDDIFFVHGHQITRTVTKDGKPLSAEEASKQDSRVKKEIDSAEKAARENKPPQPNPLSARNLLQTAKLANERRILVAGRPTIVFDVLDDPNNKSSKLEDKIVASMRGTISIDEDTGQTQDFNVTGVRDVKVGGGLVANIHKGFHLHLVNAPQTGGVWFVKDVYGGGDARIGLFFHPSASFHTEMESCHLYTVSTDQTVTTPAEKK